MNIISALVTIFGLGLFEIINSVDNAIINAEVLSTMKAASRKWFVTWGLFFSVIVVRGLLPFLIVLLLNPKVGILGTITAVFHSDARVAQSLHESAPYLLLAGGVFMIFVFFHWLFLEEKNFGLPGEKFIASQGVWFYAIVSILLTVIVWYAIQVNPYLALSAVVGSTVFFITHGFKQQAAQAERSLLKKGMSDISKILYLEVIDMTFSIDGVLGSFAFTFFVPLILIGNGLGAFVLRKITVSNIENIKKYLYIKNGAMYSILILGSIMMLDSFRMEIPFWASPLSTSVIVGYFFLKSTKVLKLPVSQ
ncbi:hypothetical protein COY90_03185 [Candidatus Roizmanbacteria bacterium CG_4_10_14_0_8_um_filter_39_9]|uniref:DUF475 domain-containing protein n=1 Tax=Candidatus Roizmanbacteria bacterium CG_4_10_14_0_8_um_filter_39_9 TaxID=1974829 RepID=A0A2M7QDK8_9BACT|nr:MAG: hypothetical protein COY90_03185 [Candidatus Roizmanbacteria bacterium CG_4_10_14_0_8_um_filter_39_9]